MNLDHLLKKMTFPPSYSRQIESLRRLQRSPQPGRKDSRTNARPLRLKVRKKKQPQSAETPRTSTPEPQSPVRRYRVLRLWKIKPGRRYYLEEIVGRDAILRRNGQLTRTPLPASCPLPPNTSERFYLQTEVRSPEDLHRIRVKWVPAVDFSR